MPQIPGEAKFEAWPQHENPLDESRVIELYKHGFAGATYDPESREAFEAEMAVINGTRFAGDIAAANNFAGASAGKLVVLFPAVTECYGYEALTSPGQKTGDCVSMAGRDVGLYTVCIDALSGVPDSETGRVEAAPEVSDKARRNGVFANEPIYKFRMHSGQGMSCDQGVRFLTKAGGLILRQKYDSVDLEEYNVSWSIPGSRGTPEDICKVGRQHQIRRAAFPDDWEQGSDYVAAGNPLYICSSLGFDDERDENGVSRRRGSWAHSWHVAGIDRRPWVQEAYGIPGLALFGHRWAKWNSGGRKIHGTNLEIPHGYLWFDIRLLNQCWMAAVSSVNGWPRKNLPDFGGDLL